MLYITDADKKALIVIKETFGNKHIAIELTMPHFFINDKPIAKENTESRIVEYGKREKDVYLRAKEYLADVYLCFQCDSFLSCGSSADYMAYLINNKKYEYFAQIKGEGGDTKTHGENKEK